MKFYDTNALLYSYDMKSEQPFIMSNLTLKQLQSIKEGTDKSEQVRYKARHLINWLMQNKIYKVFPYQRDWDKDLKKYPVLSENTDSRIILTALKIKEKYYPDLQFITFDSNCCYIAEQVGLTVRYILQKNDEYTGYKEVYCSEQDLIDFYSSFNNKNSNYYNLLNNEYVILKNQKNEIIDVQRFLGEGKGYTGISEQPLNSKMFGKIKPKDVYQKMAIDSILHNKITVLRGPAGTGKSLLSLGFFFDQLEKNKIDKLIIFCNTVATQGSAKLGYYPGNKNEKLLDSQIGNFLASKIGDKMAVQMLIDNGELVLLPMSDIRGFDTTGLRSGVYITEAQNMSIDLMKLALQRIGQDSIVILDGDDKTQVDLGIYGGNNNGLRRTSKVFRGKDIYGEVTLKEIYRSKIAQIAEKM